ncbi:[FeFe] hydrogenase, group A [Entomospira culicis]|uniref:2Fe-2S iron-sulfur cluster binding domain-containing protein n=1 Tax=Entomospira culicis TaxID=2719989 RepID=A0A968GF18_9SPIO|nr:[FeFe] hydrogenase, group A [Entomospira culicis]NIZ19202.1 2Fe-2S iron-sulfur cluster binding domain-containing protein [Entomospira culicis]NIZ69416.1 2Fe-2S iron-sulfur cluster binding domain-containing protein [Entomospira culicis]WDI36532.1 [FeFe] hydrogenase, group A [Entomospira culicis]WDI38158.1 [FeFe] hydrogenase, group A [Entomospira culicis]
MSESIQVKINNIDIEVPAGTTILKAASLAGFKVPTLCYHPDVQATGACGICVVKMENGKTVRSCNMKAIAGKSYTTHDEDLLRIRRTILSEVLAKHPQDCLLCRRNGSCELQDLAAEFNLRTNDLPREVPDIPVDDSCAVVMDMKYCIQCMRCVSVCSKQQNVNALELVGKGREARIQPVGGGTLAESPCVKCGQCAAHCPVNALKENEAFIPLRHAIANKELFTTVQIAPAVRVSLGEEFGFKQGDNVAGKIYAALRRLGFNAIFDTNFGADMTIMEEATEFVHRFQNKEMLPLITTCCPSWVEYLERFYDDMIPHFSSSKSPMMMTGVLTKRYYAQKNNIDPQTIFNVAIMPCTSKKEEKDRKEMAQSDGLQDIDLVLTTRELARMIRQAGIDFTNLKDEAPDSLLGDFSGAGLIFGATGGVMEAALRTAAACTGEKLEKLEFQAVRGLTDIKETTIKVAGQDARIAVTHGLVNVQHVLDRVREAKKNNEELPWHFIEVMACKGGCVSGGGQTYSKEEDTRALRAKGLYDTDKDMSIRQSHENPSVQEIYATLLEHPGSHKAHELLHTHYTPRPFEKK